MTASLSDPPVARTCKTLAVAIALLLGVAGCRSTPSQTSSPGVSSWQDPAVSVIQEDFSSSFDVVPTEAENEVSPDPEAANAVTPEIVEAEPKAAKRSWFGRRSRPTTEATQTEPRVEAPAPEPVDVSERTEKRGWFGRKRGDDEKPEPTESDVSMPDEDITTESVNTEPSPLAAEAETNTVAVATDSADTPAKRGWFWGRSKKSDDEADADPIAPKPSKRDLLPRLRPGLGINVTVEVSGKLEVEASDKRIDGIGEVALPLVGSVSVEGLNVKDAATLLEKRYAEFYVSKPRVYVEFALSETSDVSPWGYVTVLGRVASPGRIPIPATRDLKVSTAIQNAGGLASSAKDSAVRVTRQLQNGETERYTVDLDRIGSKGRTDEDIVLKNGDIVYVPELIF